MIETEVAGDQYVASFGKDAALGCFTAAEPIALERGTAVLLKTPRGVEVGAILCPASIRQARLIGAQVRGELLRPLDAADREQLDQLEGDASRLLDEARQFASATGVGVVLLDAELLFDGRHAVVQILHDDADALADYVAALEARTGITIQLANLAQAIPDEPEHHEAEHQGCGKPDCGSGEGGCTSCGTGGGCTSCSAGDGGVDMRQYFSHLRDKMTDQRVPLN